MKQLGVLLFPLDGMLDRHRVTSMGQLGCITLSPTWDARPSQGTNIKQLGVLLNIITVPLLFDTGQAMLINPLTVLVEAF